jgi:hypothetical protein
LLAIDPPGTLPQGMPGIGPVPVLNAGYLQFGVSVYTQHDALFPPPIKAPLPGLIEGPAFMGWPPGIISHKKALKVFADGNMAIQSGHDVGYLIPHIAIPLNALMAINTAFSKHKVVFAASQVKVGGSNVGTYLWFLFGEICAQPYSLPTGVIVLLKCTVWTSLTWTDIARALLTFAVDAAFDTLWSKFSKLKPVEKLLKRFPETKFPKWVGNATVAALGRGFIVPEMAGRAVNKAIDHVLKSWVVSPLVTGLPFGKIGIGRGNWGPSHKFFSW